MGIEYCKAPEVEEIAKSMVEMFHEHLKKANISYVFADKARVLVDGRTILGRAAGRNKLDKLLSERKEDFVIIISKDRWGEQSEEERRALVDHELCHCGIAINSKGESRFVLRGHPIEEFPENLQRFPKRKALIGDLIEHPPSAIAIKQKRNIEVVDENKEEEEE